MKALLITPYYNCITECALLYFKDKIDILIFMEVDSITVNEMIKKYHLVNILCLSYEDYLSNSNIKIIDTNLWDFNLSLNFNTFIFSDFSPHYNYMYNKLSTNMYFRKKYDSNMSLINYTNIRQLLNKFFKIPNKFDDKIYLLIKNITKNKKEMIQYCYHISWHDYFFNKSSIIYTDDVVLLNILYELFNKEIQTYIYKRVESLL